MCGGVYRWIGVSGWARWTGLPKNIKGVTFPFQIYHMIDVMVCGDQNWGCG